MVYRNTQSVYVFEKDVNLLDSYPRRNVKRRVHTEQTEGDQVQVVGSTVSHVFPVVDQHYSSLHSFEGTNVTPFVVAKLLPQRVRGVTCSSSEQIQNPRPGGKAPRQVKSTDTNSHPR